jgi:tetratricopeptide (TPR) repeat protein
MFHLTGKNREAMEQFRAALANENYSKAATLDGSLAEAWHGVGVTDRSLAEDLLNRAARNGEKAESSRVKVQGLLDHALKALTRAVELDPNSARIHLIMAEAMSDSGKLAEASAEYRTAMKLDPHLEAAYLGLASQYWKRRQFDDALPLLKHVRAGFRPPWSPEAMRASAWRRVWRQEYEGPLCGCSWPANANILCHRIFVTA